MSKILIVEHFLITPHFETGIEIALNEKVKNGNRVKYVFINLFYSYLRLPSHLKLSFFQNNNWLKKENSRIKKILDKIEVKFGIPVISLKNLNFISFLQSTYFALSHPYTISELKEYKYKNSNLGVGVLSTYSSILGDDSPKIYWRSLLLKKLLFESAIAYDLTNKILQKEKPEVIYTFNGRNNIDNAIVKAAINKNVEVYVHERGCNFKKYDIFHYPLHSFENLEKRMLAYLKNIDLTNNLYHSTSKQFFEQSRSGVETSWLSFSDKFIKKELEKTTKKRFIYFTSSDDEFLFIDDQELKNQPLFSDQKKCIEFLIHWFSKKDDLELLIRVHPNLKNKSAELRNYWHNLKGSNIQVINSYSEFDSYSLIEQSDVVLSYGSTVGIEATFIGKPSILLGLAIYRYLDCTYNPVTIFELEKLLSLELKSIDKTKCLPYGYYFMTFGIEYNYYNPISLFEGELLI